MSKDTMLPEQLRKRMLHAVDTTIAANSRIGSDPITINGAVVFPAELVKNQTEQLYELRDLLGSQVIQQS